MTGGLPPAPGDPLVPEMPPALLDQYECAARTLSDQTRLLADLARRYRDGEHADEIAARHARLDLVAAAVAWTRFMDDAIEILDRAMETPNERRC